MRVPYTPDAVKAIRHAANDGQSRGDVQVAFGWDAGMLDRVCRQHGIELRAGEPPKVEPARSVLTLVRAKAERPLIPKSEPHHVTISISVNPDVYARLKYEARARQEPPSAYVRHLMTQALLSGEAARCPKYRGDAARSRAIGVHVSIECRAGLLAAMAKSRCTSMSEFGAAIIEQHFTDTE